MPTDDIEDFAREECLDSVDVVDPAAAEAWVEDLRSRGLVTDCNGADLALDLRNAHLLAQVSANHNKRLRDKLQFYAQIVAVLARRNAGLIRIEADEFNKLPEGTVIEEAKDEAVLIHFITSDGKALS